MSAYPKIPQHVDSAEANYDNIAVDRATSGRVRSRVLGDRVRKSFSVVHVCTEEQKDEIARFYDDNRGKTFDFEWRGDKKTYECIFISVFSESVVKGRGGKRLYQIICPLAEAL